MERKRTGGARRAASSRGRKKPASRRQRPPRPPVTRKADDDAAHEPESSALPVAARPLPPDPEPAPGRPKGRLEQLRDSLLDLVSQIPSSREAPATLPSARARSLILQASSKAAVISGTLALPPGLVGLLTILPELRLIWQVQAQLVADVAAVYGKSYQLGQREMVFCLFRHVAGHLVKDVVVRAGERFLVRRTQRGVLQRLLQRIGLEVAERGAGRAVSRLVPIVGALGIGGYAFYDTTQVGRTAVSLFEKEIVDEDAAE